MAQLPLCDLAAAQNYAPDEELAYHKFEKNQHMSRAGKLSFSIQQRLTALACFVALILLYAPIATSAVMMMTGACCSGEQCPIHGNHRHPQKGDEAPMNCGYSGHDRSPDSCSMSCCHNMEQRAVHSNLFLLTSLSSSTLLALLFEISLAPARLNFSPAHTPLAPPPKILVV